MMKHVNFETALTLHKLGYDEYTIDLYMAWTPGIRGVKTDPATGLQVAEKVWHYGNLNTRDDDWGITYPSEYWIPAPFVFDAVTWLETYMGIKIIPVYTANRNWHYMINFSDKLGFLKNSMLENISAAEYASLESMFDAALNHMMHSARKDDWVKLMEEKFWSNIK